MLVYLNIKKFFICFLLTVTVFSQSIKYDGIIYYDDITMKYHLDLEIENNKITGFSITEKGNVNETKNNITGFYDKENKTLNIRELNIVQTKSNEEKLNFCYLNLELEEIGKNTLMGSFTGYYSDNSVCAKGYINLIKSKKIKKIKKRVKRTEKNIVKKEEIILNKNKNISINSNESDLIIQVWDSKKADGDKISLIINNEIILNDYEVSHKKKLIKLKLNKNENIIKIIATSIGKQKPNTVGVEIINSKYIHPFLTKLDINESAEIKINFK